MTTHTMKIDGESFDIISRARMGFLDKWYRCRLLMNQQWANKLRPLVEDNESNAFSLRFRHIISSAEFLNSIDDLSCDLLQNEERMWLMAQLWMDFGGDVNHLRTFRKKSVMYHYGNMRYLGTATLSCVPGYPAPFTVTPETIPWLSYEEPKTPVGKPTCEILDEIEEAKPPKRPTKAPTPKLSDWVGVTTEHHPEKNRNPYTINPEITMALNQIKEPTFTENLIGNNKHYAVSGAYLEGGRIANNQIAKLLAKKAPMMVRGYIDTPIGKLVIANLAKMAIDHFRPEPALRELAGAMMAKAYQEVLEDFDIEGMIEELVSDPKVKSALAKVTPNHSDKPVKASEALGG